MKEFLLEKIAEKQSCFDSGNYNDFVDGVKTICELMLISIDNQIKEIKGKNYVSCKFNKRHSIRSSSYDSNNNK